MTECNRKDLAEVLILALPSSQVPEKAAEILHHTEECPHCREELDMYANLATLIRKHRDNLAPAVYGCPDADALVGFASATEPDPAIKDHLAYCCECREQVETLRRVIQEQSDAATITDRPTVAELGFLRDKVVERYGAQRTDKQGLIQRFFSEIMEGLNFPSLAVGAVATALLLVCVLPRAIPQQSYRLALSDVSWPSGQEEISKTDHWLEPVPESVKEVALVILDGRDKAVAQKDIDALYEQFSRRDVIGPTYTVISPSDLKHALAGSPGSVRDLSGLWSQVQTKTRADYFIAVQITGEPRSITLNATLFGRGNTEDLGRITQTRVTTKLLPERIKGMASDLIAQALPEKE